MRACCVMLALLILGLGSGRVHGQASIRLSGTPEELGRQHGSVLREQVRYMVSDYLKHDLADGRLKATMAARVARMKPSLPEWYRRELAACATAAGVDEDALLFAQCEGDIRSLHGCTTYVAFGEATPDGEMQIGRNFDYWGIDQPGRVATVLAVVPRPEDGHAFVAVGWAGILGGWTYFNEKGVFIANNLGGFHEKNPEGIPTLILERVLAQRAGSVDEAIALLRELPRMRGQTLIIGQTPDAARGRPAAAAVVNYDAKRVEVTQAENGLAFHSSIGRNREEQARRVAGKQRAPYGAIREAGSAITLHSVAIRPEEGAIWIAHGRHAAHEGTYRQYDLAELLKR